MRQIDVFFKQICFGLFKSREKRFFVYLEENIQNNFHEIDNFPVAYCSNVGKMSGVLIPGSTCLFSRYNGKLQWKWEAVKINNQWIGVNTQNPNKIGEVLLKKLWPNEVFKSEVNFHVNNQTYRADFASQNKIIEIKNVHWKVEDRAFFPDCITQRGTRQLSDLINLQKDFQCYVFYILQRNDLNIVSVADWIDLKYFQACQRAQKNGVVFRAFNININEIGLSINEEILVDIKY